jgi:hypothetical protein
MPEDLKGLGLGRYLDFARYDRFGLDGIFQALAKF